MLTVLALVIPLVVWNLLSYAELVDPRFLPTPTAVFQAGLQMFAEEDLLTDILASSGRVLLGFLVAAIVGIPIGVAMGTFYSMESLFGSIVGTVRYMPVAAFMPLIGAVGGVRGNRQDPHYFSGIVFLQRHYDCGRGQVYSNEMLNVAYTLGANRRDLLWRVILPASLPSIVDALRVNVAGAWNFLVISELIAAQNGLGFKIIYSQRFLQTIKSCSAL